MDKRWGKGSSGWRLPLAALPFSLIGIGLAEPAFAQAAAPQPVCNVRGPWTLFQANGSNVELNIAQDDARLSGTARSGAVNGAATGQVTGRNFTLTLQFDNGAIGDYTGRFLDNDTLSGTAVERANPINKTTWNSGAKAFFGCPAPSVASIAIAPQMGDQNAAILAGRPASAEQTPLARSVQQGTATSELRSQQQGQAEQRPINPAEPLRDRAADRVVSVTGRSQPPIDIPKAVVIAEGLPVSVEQQRKLGLVTVANAAGACSATLLHRSWVLTARHCVAAGMTGPLMPVASLNVSAAWDGANVVKPIAIREIPGPGGATLDIALLRLPSKDFGEAPTQAIATSVSAGQDVRKYGQGYFRAARPGPNPANPAAGATPASGAGKYRTADFTVSDLAASSYALGAQGPQVGMGGDSGGPDREIDADLEPGGIIGVQSTCFPKAYVPGKPESWDWATGVSSCTSVRLQPVRSAILTIIEQGPAAPAAKSKPAPKSRKQ